MKSTKRKTIFGRNIFTILCVILLFFVVIVAVGYIKSFNDCKYKSFVDKQDGESFIVEETDNDGNTIKKNTTYNTNKDDNLKRVSGSKFNDLGIDFSCTNYNEDSFSVTYEVRLWKNENDTRNITSATVNVCMTANWIDYIGYGTKGTCKVGEDKEEALGSTNYRKILTITGVKDFPAKAKTWPVKVKVSEPTIYLYLSYSYVENAKNKNCNYILKYSYDDVVNSDTIGGIRK